jgi:hypothetical protein
VQLLHAYHAHTGIDGCLTSLARDEVGSVCPGVVGDGVVDVVEEVLNGPLAGDNGLHEESKHGEHGEAAVLDLLHLELRRGVGVVGEAQRVEGPAGVHLAERAAADAVALDEAHEHDLTRPDGQDALRVYQVRVAEVVETALGEDLRAGLEPNGLAELDAVLGQDLGEHATERAQHGPAAVDHLQLAVPGEGLRVRGEASGVPPVVAGELAGQVGRSLLGERAKVLGAVRAIPVRVHACMYQSVIRFLFKCRSYRVMHAEERECVTRCSGARS